MAHVLLIVTNALCKLFVKHICVCDASQRNDVVVLFADVLMKPDLLISAVGTRVYKYSAIGVLEEDTSWTVCAHTPKYYSLNS